MSIICSVSNGITSNNHPLLSCTSNLWHTIFWGGKKISESSSDSFSMLPGRRNTMIFYFNLSAATLSVNRITPGV